MKNLCMNVTRTDARSSPVPFCLFNFVCTLPLLSLSYFSSCCLTLFLKSGESEGSAPLFVLLFIGPTFSFSMGPNAPAS